MTMTSYTGFWGATDIVDENGRIVVLGKVQRFRNEAQWPHDKEGSYGKVYRCWPVEARDFTPGGDNRRDPSRAQRVKQLATMMNVGTFTLPENPTGDDKAAQFRLDVLIAADMLKGKAAATPAEPETQEPVAAAAVETKPAEQPAKRQAKPRRKITAAERYARTVGRVSL